MPKWELVDFKKILEGYKDPCKIKIYAETSDDKVEIIIDFGPLQVIALSIVLRNNKLEVSDYWGWGS
jgi:hypothetical protein